jgi:hypothetical protein
MKADHLAPGLQVGFAEDVLGVEPSDQGGVCAPAEHGQQLGPVLFEQHPQGSQVVDGSSQGTPPHGTARSRRRDRE